MKNYCRKEIINLRNDFLNLTTRRGNILKASGFRTGNSMYGSTQKGDKMKLVRVGAFTALALFAAQQANAQSLHGVRAEADVGIDRFYSEGNHDDHVGWGGEIGADFDLGGFVVGPYGSFWNARGENVTRDGPGVAYRKSFEEWGAGLRAGTLITPSTLLYVKGGWVINEQRKYFNADPVATPGIPVNDAYGDYYNHYRTRGWQVGAGIEQDVSNMFYVKGEGRYSNYRTNSSRLAFLIGAGVRFGCDCSGRGIRRSSRRRRRGRRSPSGGRGARGSS